MRTAPLLALIALLFAASCQRPAAPGRVIVLGLDGMDPETVDLLMAEGKMPNFATLRTEGAYGRLMSSKPMLSPIIWTTIATGKPPEQHRIGHFVAVNEQTGEQLPVTSQMRKVKALWNILSEAGRRVDVVGWWATWPAESVNGAVVSDHTCYHFLFEEGATGAAAASGSVHPAALESVIRPMIKRADDLTMADVARFVQVNDGDLARPFDFNDDLSHFKWALATAESYRAIGAHLWQADQPDVLLVYIEATDSVAHLFGHLFRARGLAGELAAQQQRYGRAVEEMYRYADRLVGEFMALMDERTTLLVLSDHGFELGALPDDPSTTRDMRRVSERYHRLEGILYLYGNHVRARRRIDGATLLDIAPTLLALTGVSPARDMPGRVLDEALDIAPAPRQVASYEGGGAADRAAADRAAHADAEVDPAILERLRSLGYLDAQSPKGDRNLAAVLFQAGKYAEAAQAYEELVRENSQDPALRASWAGALGALGRYDEALAQLDAAIQQEPLNPEAYHNRGVIYERQGDRERAIAEYRTALRYSPQYAPSQQALFRLTGSAVASGPRDESERQAQVLAERASQAARRGDYAGAMQTLDEAERLAPRYALIQQYRSNVAFLMGDRERAKAALRAALALEPDNALFRTNLQRLEETR
jgi:tetratricopeptide (TPR) repeat protein